MIKDKLIEDVEHVSGQSNKPLTAPAHSLPFTQVAEQLEGNLDDGLTAEEAKKRLEEYGNNDLGEQKGVQPVKILIGQIANALTLVSLSLASFHTFPNMNFLPIGPHSCHGRFFRYQVLD
jgi:Na+-exporting ATPase